MLSDNGGEFRSTDFRSTLAQLGVRHTLIRAGRRAEQRRRRSAAPTDPRGMLAARLRRYLHSASPGSSATSPKQPLGARVESVPAQTPADAVMADQDPATALLAQLARDPRGPRAGVAEREGDDPLLQQRRDLLRIRGHRRSLGRKISNPCRSTRRFHT
jgi:transposase InsO family protein